MLLIAMFSLSPHQGLREGSRLGWLTAPRDGDRHWLQLAILFGCGSLAAVATSQFDFSLRIPGHAILRAIFPMVLGLSLAPRRGGGTIMGLSALATWLVMHTLSPAGELSLGAMTSSTLVGPMLDLSLSRAPAGWRLYFGCSLAGLAANVGALFVKGGSKLLAPIHAGSRPFASWATQAGFSYVICGVLAGLLSAAIWFQFTRSQRSETDSTP